MAIIQHSLNVVQLIQTLLVKSVLDVLNTFWKINAKRVFARISLQKKHKCNWKQRHMAIISAT
jgi:hypothetical protein